jgi:hypothetical protein
MITAFSRILLAVPSLSTARAEYEKLLGSFTGGSVKLRNVEIVLQADESLKAPDIKGLGLLHDGSTAGSIAAKDDRRGLYLPIDSHRFVSQATAVTSTGISAVDHIVLMTADADDCIRLFGDGGFGMRLALDQMVPRWGGRMLFFRCGKMTLEVIHNIEEPPPQDLFWGITYLCENLEFSLARLDDNGVDHSEIRTGRKPGTRVATINSHNLGLPTLLIEPSTN